MSLAPPRPRRRSLGRPLLLAPLAGLLLAPLALLAGCAAPDAELSPADEMLGGLSEAEFRALHELRADAPGAFHGEEVTVAGARAYLSLPAGEGPFPGVVVIHEWWGLNDHVRHWTDRLAADGWAALAVDLYGGKVATTTEEAMSYMRGVERNRATGILLAALDRLRTSERVRAPRTACIGWCFGGGMALQLALNAKRLDACVMYYGRPVTDPERLRAIQASLLAIFGGRDESIPASEVEAFDLALDEAGVAHRVLVFDAQHAFANPSSARYDAAAAEAAWTEVRAFLAEELGG